MITPLEEYAFRTDSRPAISFTSNNGAADSWDKENTMMSTMFKRAAVSLAAVGALSSGMIVVAATDAMAATPCGLSYTTGDVPGGPLKIVYYKIKNCHGSTVKRKLDIAGTTDGQCHTIKPGETASGERVIAGWAGVRDIKPC